MKRHQTLSDNIPPIDGKNVAKAIGLRYVLDSEPGIRRLKMGKGFQYRDPQGTVIRSVAVRQRIYELVIPPAWTDVWICADPNGHLQVTGRDARGRKQYRYHPNWVRARSESKYDRMLSFAAALPGLRRRVRRDLRRRDLCREKVLALVVRLLEETLIRVGNDEYARENGSFGLATLRDHHAKIRGSKITFQFRGKSGVRHSIEVVDARLARAVRRCQELPGQELFQYVQEGVCCDVTSTDVNAYLHTVTGQSFTAKDFRTWAGTVLMAQTLSLCEPCQSITGRNKQVVGAVKEVARKLGNTQATCRKCYVHPRIIEIHLEGSLQMAPASGVPTVRGLQAAEAFALSLLRRGLRGKKSRVRTRPAVISVGRSPSVRPESNCEYPL